MNYKHDLLYPLFYGGLSFLGKTFRKNRQSEFYVFAYHRVLDRINDFEFSEDIVTDSNDFQNQIEYISGNFNVITFEELYSLSKNEDPFPNKTALITFDDAYADFKSVVFPILKKYGLSATLFVTTSFADHEDVGWWEKLTYALKTTKLEDISIKKIGIKTKSSTLDLKMINKIIEKIKLLNDDEKNLLVDYLMNYLGADIDINVLSKMLYLGWGDLRYLNKNGVELGSHTMTHPILTRASKKIVQEEISESKKIIEENTNCDITTFCYPNGRKSDFSENIIELLKKSGYLGSVTMLHGSNDIEDPSFNWYTMKRVIPINYRYIEKQVNSSPFLNLINCIF